MERLDETDERILAELAEDARATYAEIGRAGEPVGSCRQTAGRPHARQRRHPRVHHRRRPQRAGLEHRGLRAGVPARHHRSR